MAVLIEINDIKNDVLYGLLVGRAFEHAVTLEVGKRWDLHFYPTEKGRKQGMIYQKRKEGGDFLTFEINVIDLARQSKSVTVFPREIHVDETAIQYLLRRDYENA